MTRKTGTGNTMTDEYGTDDLKGVYTNFERLGTIRKIL